MADIASPRPGAIDDAEESAVAGILAKPRLRDSDLFLIALAAAAGSLAGLGVIAINRLLVLVREVSFGLPADVHLSAATNLPHLRVLVVPAIGGLVVGGVAMLIRRWRPREIVDAIEANALFGGRMSMGDSLGLVGVTILSGGFGASVGLEAAYTQFGAALSSKLGGRLSLRRDDVRTLVGCGAAGAIGAAFNAPLAGAFYAFELIVGSYTLQTLAPVGIAALTGVLTVRAIQESTPIFVIHRHIVLGTTDYFAFFAVGLAAAGLGILAMKGVTGTEALFRRLAVPRWARPVLGGILLGTMAVPFPEMLGSGHGAIVLQLHLSYTLPFLAALVLAKIAGSAISIGSGFRGGMFSSSLFLGSVFGNMLGAVLARLVPHFAPDPLLYTLVGMGSVAAAVVGAPVTMIMLVLETTGDFSATIGVMVAVVTAVIAVRQWFGYSFATWRFHLRGLKITSPEDVGWINELRVGPMMRRDPAVIAADLPLAELHRRFPAGSTKQVFIVDAEGRLCGAIDPAEASRPDLSHEGRTVGDLVSAPPAFLLPGDHLRTALNRFSSAAQERLPVIDDVEGRRIIGYMSEAYALRRYAHELESRRHLIEDDAGIFSPTTRKEAAGAAPAERKNP